jgi:WD40 repeat protein/tetratricopeptide (TPR) repeat protein
VVPRHELRLFTAQFSHDGRRLLASSGLIGLTSTFPGSGDIGCLVWDVEANQRVGKPVRAPAAGKESVRHFAAALSPDGRRVAWSAGGEPVRVIEIDTGRPAVATPIALPGGGEIDGLAFSPDGTRLAVKAKQVRVFDAATGEPAGPPLELPGTLGRVTFGPDGRSLAACSSGSLTGDDASLRVLEAGGVSFGARDPDRFRTGAGDDTLARVWDAASGRPLTPEFPAPGTLKALALRPPGGDHLLRASLDGTVRSWDIAAGRAVFPGKRYPKPVVHAAYSPDGRWIGYATQRGPAFIVDAETGMPLAPEMSDLGTGAGTWVAFRPDGRQFAVGTAEGILFWDLTPELRPVAVIEQLLGVLTGRAAPAAPLLARPDRAAVLAWHRARYAELRGEGGWPRNALPHLDVLLAESPKDVPLRVARAECHVARRDWPAALADLDAAGGGKSTDPMILFLRGRAHFERGETRKAFAALDDAVELSSGLWQARLYRGKAKLALGDWAGADKDMANAFASDNALPIPDICAIALLRLATGRTEPHSYQQMCDALYRGRGTTADPDDLAAMAVAFACGPTTSPRPDDVVPMAVRAAQFNPNRADYRFALGLALFRAGKTDDALTFLKQAEKADAPAVRLKARLALALAAPESEAKQWLEKARADIKTAEAELAAGRSLPGTAWVEVEVLRRQAEARFKQ